MPITVWICRRRFRGLGAPFGYYATVGLSGTGIAVVLAFLLIVQAFAAQGYYDADIFVY